MWEANTRVLNAMYEQDSVLSDTTADELRKRAIASGEIEPVVVNEVNIDDETVLSGIPLGRSDSPGSGWHRLRWNDLAQRISAPLGRSGVPPCFRWFPHKLACSY
jgi:hypothetical protein